MAYIYFDKKYNEKKRLQVSKILCLGLNYDDHISEMKSNKPEEPVIFMKPSSAIIHNNKNIILPKISNDIHHEVEILIVIGKKCKNISKENALNYIEGFAVGLDLTLRDIQKKAKEKGQPWTVSKGFDTSAPISNIIKRKDIKDLNNLEIKLWINNHLKQHGNSKNMIFKFDEIISYLSNIFTLNRGDIIFTGTPSGVGPIKEGDILRAELSGYTDLNVKVKSNS